MKNSTRWIVLGLVAATFAGGCGSESPTGPSFARSTPVLESAGSGMSAGEEPGGIGNGTWTGEPGPGVVDARAGKKDKKATHPEHPEHPEHP